MNKSIKINLAGGRTKDFIREKIKALTFKYGIEGIGQIGSDIEAAVIYLHGPKEKIDELLDQCQNVADSYGVNDIQIEPYTKEKDYRGVFRIIE